MNHAETSFLNNMLLNFNSIYPMDTNLNCILTDLTPHTSKLFPLFFVIEITKKICVRD